MSQAFRQLQDILFGPREIAPGSSHHTSARSLDVGCQEGPKALATATGADQSEAEIFCHLHRPTPYPDKVMGSMIAHTLPVLITALSILVTSAPAQGDRFHSGRSSPQLLTLPKEDDAFGFVIYGDRTGGPPEGIRVLEQAVVDTNLLDPDLVMTVGDLISGYNEKPEWLDQMREFKVVMESLNMPWFPVAGNHDIYWRGKGEKPVGEHEAGYETHFGPLWYAFEHKKCWFIVLYSDEGDPETGEKNFKKPESHIMSEEQFTWLHETLGKTRGARHVFVFLHHPRWRGGRHGDHWNRVHAELVKAGNVSAVFAGHVHKIIHDGKKDGIEYLSLGTTGGSMKELPVAGYLHHFNVVVVRDQKITIATIPVGQVMDPSQITAETSADAATLNNALKPALSKPLSLATDGSLRGDRDITLSNPVARPIELTLTPVSTDSNWTFSPSHGHVTIPPRGKKTLTFQFLRRATGFDANLAPPSLRIACDYLGERVRLSLPVRERPLEITLPRVPTLPETAQDHALMLRGAASTLQITKTSLDPKPGPMTVECWFKASATAGRRCLLSKGRADEGWSLWLRDGKPAFVVKVGEKVTSVAMSTELKRPRQWHHLAGVIDATEMRIYLDGKLAQARAMKTPRSAVSDPLIVGGNPLSGNRLIAKYAGAIDELRLSTIARYQGKSFEPARRHSNDPHTLLLLHMDVEAGTWLLDASGRGHHGKKLGKAITVLASR